MNFEELSQKVKKISKDTVENVQRLNEIRILNGKINDAQKQIKSLYVEIGKKLYDQYKEEPMDGFEVQIQSINDTLVQIESLKEELRGMKGVVLCPCCNMEVAKGEKFCSNCGGKMPETEEACECDEEAAEACECEEAEAEACECPEAETVGCDEETTEEVAEEKAESEE